MKFALPILVLILSGCHSLNPASPNRSLHGVDIRQPTTQEQVEIFDKAISQLPPAVIKSIKSFTARGDDEADHFDGSSIGHCSWDRHICLLNKYYSESSIWHEASHAYHFYLNKIGSDFIDCWKMAAGSPIKGAVSHYGTTNYREDIAEWYEEVQRFLQGQHSIFAHFAYRDLLKTNPIYRRKFELLKVYGFITAEQHDRILTF